MDNSTKNKPRRKKPGPTARSRATRRRAEYPVARSVRAACVARDGHCVLANWPHSRTDCAGLSQWAHLGEQTRAKTRGMQPTERHTTAGSLMLCRLHHDCYDGRRKPRLWIHLLTDAGANGPLHCV